MGIVIYPLGVDRLFNQLTPELRWQFWMQGSRPTSLAKAWSYVINDTAIIWLVKDDKRGYQVVVMPNPGVAWSTEGIVLHEGSLPILLLARSRV